MFYFSTLYYKLSWFEFAASRLLDTAFRSSFSISDVSSLIHGLTLIDGDGQTPYSLRHEFFISTIPQVPEISRVQVENKLREIWRESVTGELSKINQYT